MAISDRIAERQRQSSGCDVEVAQSMCKEAYDEMMARTSGDFESRQRENVLAMAFGKNFESMESSSDRKQQEVLALPRAPAVPSSAHRFLPQVELV